MNTNTTTPNNNNNNNNQQQSQQDLHNRSKCDQVVYEAIVKAAEVIVRSRCSYPTHTANTSTSTTSHANTCTSTPNNNNNASNTASRFNLDVGEVEEVRKIMQRYRTHLHVPLRLDVFFEHNNGSNNTPVTESNSSSSITSNSNHSSSRKSNIGSNSGSNNSMRCDLLERWCIEYVPSSSNSLSNSNNNHAHATKEVNHNNVNIESNSDLLASLRMVCKRVIIALRTIHCYARMMPGQRLRHKLHASTATSNNSNGTIMQQNHPYHHHVEDGNNNNSNGAYYYSQLPRKKISGNIGFSLYSSHDNSPDLLTSSFLRHSFGAVMTPFGALRLSVLYSADAAGQERQSCLGGIIPQQQLQQAVHVHVHPSSGNTCNAGGLVAGSTSASVSNRSSSVASSSMSHVPPLAEQASLNHHPNKNQNQNQNQHYNLQDENSSLPTKKTMSGLSLALMNDCQISEKADAGASARQQMGYPNRFKNSPDNNHINSNNNIGGRVINESPPSRLKYYPRQISAESNDSVVRRNSFLSTGISISSTPPFSQSPNPAYYSGMTTPITISATPPFHNTPINSRRDSPLSQHGMLLPPNSLETLAVSPFKAAAQMRDGTAIATSFDQAMSSLPLGTPKNGPQNEQELSSADVEPPFVGSFPTPGAAFDLFSRLSSTRSVNSGTALGAASSGLNGTADDDDLPFAVDNSEHTSQYGEASATTYAQQYSNPQRLQLFDSMKASSCEKQRLSESCNTAGGGPTEQELADQLADFHTFGATLSRIVSTPGNDGGGSSNGEAQTVQN